MNNRIRMKDLFFDGHMEGLSEKDGKNILEIKREQTGILYALTQEFMKSGSIKGRQIEVL